MNTCNNCGKTIGKRYSKCTSCSHIGLKNNKQYSEDISSKTNRFYNLYRAIIHFKGLAPTLDVHEFVEHLLSQHTDDELLGSMLFRKDPDKDFGIDNYRLSDTRDYRGNAKKSSTATQSEYIGVHYKIMKSGNKVWSASLNGKYMTGICGMDEYHTALARDEFILNNDLQHKYKLNVL